jgi:flagellar assembly factor FliW
MNELALMVHTTRFGDIEVAPDGVLHFPDGLIGLGGTDYALLPAGHGPFTWLQSLSDPTVALPLTDPRRFFPGFRFELGDAEGEHLEIDAAAPSEIYVTVRASAVAAECTANLKAPIVVVGEPGSGPRRAHQVINHATGVELRAPLFPSA